MAASPRSAAVPPRWAAQSGQSACRYLKRYHGVTLARWIDRQFPSLRVALSLDAIKVWIVAYRAEHGRPPAQACGKIAALGGIGGKAVDAHLRNHHGLTMATLLDAMYPDERTGPVSSVWKAGDGR